jgi:DegV family protein with EDD domain
VIDSRTVSSGLGTLVLEAAGEAKRGGDIETVLQLVDGMVRRTHVMAVLNTLENLKKGGRIGGAKAMLGSMLSIKPVIDITGGEVHEAGKGRTRIRALHLLADRLLAAGEVEHVAVMHGGAADIDEFLALVAPRFSRTDLRLGELGAVIGAHGGAEIIGVSWVER